MDMLDYETVLAVYRYGSWTEAAYATFQSTSSVSKRVSKIEKALGVQLFERSNRAGGSVLTSMGSIIMPYIRQIVDIYGNISTQADELRRSMQENLRVGYQIIAGSIGTEELLARFRQENRDISISHTLRNKDGLAEMLGNNELDCAFLFVFDEDVEGEFAESLKDKGLTVLPYLRCDTLWVGVSNEHYLAGRKSVKLEELKDEVFIVNSMRGKSSLCRMFNMRGVSDFQQLPFKVRPIDFVSKMVVIDYITSGKGVLPTICMPPREAEGVVSFIKVEDVTPKAAAVFMYSKCTASKQVKTMLGFVKDYAEGRRQLEYK